MATILKNLLKTIKEKPLIDNKGILLLTSIFFLMGVGLVQIYSSSFIYATDMYGDGLFFFKKQLLFVFAGVIALFVVSKVPYKYLFNFGLILFVLSIILLILTTIPGVGVKAGGASRWLPLFYGFRIEPAEFFKVTFPFCASLFLHKFWGRLKMKNTLFLLFLLLFPSWILLMQPDMGTLVIYFSVFLCMLFIKGLKWRYLFVSFLLLVAMFSFFIMTSNYRMERVKAFLDPWESQSAGGLQTIQSLLGLHAGGLTGIGLGEGQSKLYFLPEAHTDFTISVLGEELGFIGVSCILIIFGIIIFRMFYLSSRIMDDRLRFVSLGMAFTFGLQVFINFGVSLGLLPVKGLALPFLSYGGSSLLSTCILFGLFFAIQSRRSLR